MDRESLKQDIREVFAEMTSSDRATHSKTLGWIHQELIKMVEHSQNIEEHLKRLNGSVAKHENSLNGLNEWKSGQEASIVSNWKIAGVATSLVTVLVGSLVGVSVWSFNREVSKVDELSKNLNNFFNQHAEVQK